MKLNQILLPTLALSGAAILLLPQDSEAFSLLGFSLSTNQRDHRIFNNFTDAGANNNTSDHINFPGYSGAPLAIWKAGAEWGSVIRNGNGLGDSTQSVLGDGGANFDASWQGLANGVGGINDNIHSELDGAGGGVIAFTESPSTNGWRIRYYSSFNWADGPGSVSGTDIQGIATHEYGHAIGMGHSTNGGATMIAQAGGTGSQLRSINSDDIAGLQAAYGAASATKPQITAVSLTGSVLTITGTNFDASNVEVWFTQVGSGGNGTPVKVVGLSSTGGGTQLAVNVPGTAGPGDVMVKNGSSTSGSTLSNAWGFDPTGGISSNPPTISSLLPNTVNAVEIDAATPIVLLGTGFSTIDTVTSNGAPLTTFAGDYQVVSDTELRIFPVVPQALGPVAIQLSGPTGSVGAGYTVVANTSAPVLEVFSSDPSFLFTALPVEVWIGSKPGDLAFLLVSTSLVPTNLPGIVNLGIGAGFTNLFNLGAKVVSPATATAEWNFPISLPLGTKLHFQAAVVDGLTGALPLTSTNVQSTTVLF